MFCQTCGNKIQNSRGICVYCAAGDLDPAAGVVAEKHDPTSTPAARRPVALRQSGSNAGKLIGSMISVGICVWILYQIGAFGDIRSAVTEPTLHNMHDDFRVGYWGYRVEQMSEPQSLGYGASLEKPDGKFVVVFLTVQNNDTTASALPSPILKDGEGREHSSKLVFGSGLPDEDLTIKTLNPGVSKRGYFIFDIPRDAHDLDLQLILSGGHQSGERAAVNLY